MSDAILSGLIACLGADLVSTDDSDCQAYGRDRTTAYDPKPVAIVFPKQIEQVQALVAYANEVSLGIVPSGGRTGLSGGAVAMNGEVVVSFDKMRTIKDFNAIDQTVVCEAGVITSVLQDYAEEQGLFYPVDFASSGSSQIGGNIATNAGGIKVIRYGMTRDWVLGLKVVTGSGEILELNRGLMKNNAGYDLSHLFIGSEGTLGLIVEATIKLARPPQNLNVLVLAVPEFAAIMEVLQAFQAKVDLTAFEFFSDLALEKVVQVMGVAKPCEVDAPFYALIEFEAANEAVLDEVMSLFEFTVEQGWVLDGVLSQSEAQAKSLWRLREDISETLAEWTPYKNDLSTTVAKVPGFLADVDAVVAKNYPDFEIVWFGHIGDGNVHLNILKPEGLDRQSFLDKCHHVSEWVFEIVQRYEGSVSAEHGVGLLKKDFLQYSRSAAEIALMKGVKAVFDPKGVMNPGKIF